MFDWVPLFQYTHYFDLFVLFLVLFAVFQCFTNQVLQKHVVEANAIFGTVITVLIILYMGLRPVSYVFGDMVHYANRFYNTDPLNSSFYFGREWAFNNLTILMAKLGNVSYYFFICSFIYIASLWWAMKRIFGNYFWIPLLVIISMFTFWTYGVNGIRNGLGASVFILALSFANNIPLMILWAFIALGFHQSVLLMIGAALLAWFLNRNKLYLGIWLAAIPISLRYGWTLQFLLASTGFMQSDERMAAYLTRENEVGELVETSSSFRWDFLLYSAMAVGVAYYFIYLRKFKDQYYIWLFNIYLICNAFWIIVIRASYSNRIAQLSWFIMPIILIYPFIKKRFWQYHERYLGLALLAFYAFAFYYNIIRS